MCDLRDLCFKMTIKRYKILTTIAGITGPFVTGVCIWTISEPFNIPDVGSPILPHGDQVSVMEHPPRIGIAAGLLISIISIYHCIANLKNMKTFTSGLFLLLISDILLLATFGTALSLMTDMNKFMDIIKKNNPTVHSHLEPHVGIMLKRLVAILGVTFLASLLDVLVLVGGIILWLSAS